MLCMSVLGACRATSLAFYESVELQAQGAKWRRPPRRCDVAGSSLHPCPAASIKRQKPGELKLPCPNSS
jgi:hypothetical protein